MDRAPAAPANVTPLRMAWQAALAATGTVIALFFMFAITAQPGGDGARGNTITPMHAATAILTMIGMTVWLAIVAWKHWRVRATRGYAIGIALGVAIGLLFVIVCLVT